MASRMGYLFAAIVTGGVLAAGQGTLAQQPAPTDNSSKQQHTPGGTAPGPGAHEHGSAPNPGATKDMQDKKPNMPGMPCCSSAPKK